MAGNLPESEARAMLDLEKFITDERLYWEESPEHSTFRVFNCGLVDSSGISIPGFTVEIVYRVHPRFDDCKYTLALMHFLEVEKG